LLLVPKLLPALLFGAVPLPALLFGKLPLPVLLFGTVPRPALLLGKLPLPAELFGKLPLPVLPLDTGPLLEGLDAGPLLPVLVGAAVCPPAGWLAAGAAAWAAGAGALLAGAVEVVCLSLSFCAYTVPDEANSTATNAVARQPDKSPFQIRRALIEFLL
jgi:hypothetical protein